MLNFYPKAKLLSVKWERTFQWCENMKAALVGTVIIDGAKSRSKFKYTMWSDRWCAERSLVGRHTMQRGI